MEITLENLYVDTGAYSVNIAFQSHVAYRSFTPLS